MKTKIWKDEQCMKAQKEREKHEIGLERIKKFKLCTWKFKSLKWRKITSKY